MKTVAIGVARMNSTRLPGKVLKPLAGHPVLEWVVRALRCTAGIDEIWIATTTNPKDDRIAAWCFKHGVRCHRGSEADVLQRVHDTAVQAQADVIVKVTCDEPLLDPAIIGAVVRLQKETGAPYVSNTNPRTFADGEDVDVFTWELLAAANREAIRAIDRDAVCPWMQRNQSRFPSETVINWIGNKEQCRWVLDSAEDYLFCQEIAERLTWHKGPPSQLDILAILDKEPDLQLLNKSGIMNERYFDACAQEPLYERTYDRSQAFYEKAHAVIPLAAQTFSKSAIQYPQPSPLFLTHGQGGKVWDIDSNEYIDMVGALLPNILGYRDPDVDAAIRRQLNRGISFSLATELEAELAELLVKSIPCADMVRFGKNGSDATTAAVRLSRAYTGRDRILTCNQYHGWGDSLLAGSERGLGIPKALADLTVRIPFGDTQKAADEISSEQYAAVIAEPSHDPNFLQELRTLATRHGTILIFDEIITGWRWALGGGQEHFNVTPDLAAFSKSMANGMPLSAIVGSRSIMRLMEPPSNIFFSGTYMAETLSLAAGIATINKLTRLAIPNHLRKTADWLRFELRKAILHHGLVDCISIDDSPLTRLTFSQQTAHRYFMTNMISSGTLIVSSNNLCYAHDSLDLRRVLKSYDHAFSVLSNKMAIAV